MKILFPTTNYVVFDYETTGIEWQSNDVIQMSAMKVKGDTVESFNRFVKLNRPVPELITSLTGVTDEKLQKDGVDPDQAWFEFWTFIEKLPLVGHNSINFDRFYLEKFFKKYDYKIPGPQYHIDTAMMYKAMKLGIHPKYYETHFDFCRRVSEIRAYGVKFKLTLACEELKIDTSKLTAHQSDSDVIMTNELYKFFNSSL